MKYYPVFLDLNGKGVLVVGGGKVAERKVTALLASGTNVRVVSPRVTRRLLSLSQRGSIDYRKRPFKEVDLEGIDLVISATNDPEVNRTVHKLAKSRHIFCNVVDQPFLCSFIAPAVTQRGDIQIAISTSGRSPALAVHLKKEIGALLDQSYNDFLILLSSLREELRVRLPNPKHRARLLGSLVESQALDLLRRQGREAAWQHMKEIVDDGIRWNPTGKPVVPFAPPVGRNPEQRPPAEAGACVEGSHDHHSRMALRGKGA